MLVSDKNSGFVEKYKDVLTQFSKHKLSIYRKSLEYSQNRIKEIDQSMKDINPFAGIKVIDLYPDYTTHLRSEKEFKNIISLIEKNLSVSIDTLRRDLLLSITDTDLGIESIIGRETIKDQVASLIFTFSKSYHSFLKSFNNIALLGSAGIGKSRLAQTIAFVLNKSHILAKDRVNIVTRSDLVAGYVGQTAMKTKSVLLSSLESILFIDEAYQLTPCSQQELDRDSYGKEAMTEIVNFIDKYIGLIIVIVAGYEGVMNKCFFASNEGLTRRFPSRYLLSPYSNSDLTNILIKSIKEQMPDVKIDNEIADILYSLISNVQLDNPEAFKNQAGDMLNLASYIVKSIYNSYNTDWERDKISIIVNGFNDYMATKGLYIK